MRVAQAWAAEYEAALRDYLSGSGETALHRAYELGRKAIEERLSILEVTTIQQELLADVVAESSGADPRWQIERITEFFIESLSPFEMTQRGYQEANAKLLRWKHVFEHAGWGIVICSNDSRRMEIMNPAFARLHGYAVEQVTGRPLADMFVPDFREPLAGQLHQVTLQGHHVFDSMQLRQDGTTFPSSVDATAVRGAKGEVLYLAINLQDVTERRRNEQALEKAKNEAEEANRELEAFSYSVAHDLRAPLRAINGFARLLEEDHAAALDGEGRRKLQIVADHAKRMGMLIDDLLEFSRLSRTSVNSFRFDLDRLVQEVAQELVATNSGRKIDFQLSSLGQVRADPSLLRQVMVNLLGNAVKYTGRRDVARIEVGTSREGNEQKVWVRDNGAGFDPNLTHKLFGVFQRLHSLKEFEGTGIGLALVQRIIQRHGGRVWAEGAIDQGATFFFTIPGQDDKSSSG